MKKVLIFATSKKVEASSRCSLQVTCKKDVATEEVYFDAARRLQFPGMSADCAPGDCPRELPGWDNIRCVPSEYPSFKEPECNCLGDTHLDAEKSLQGGALSTIQPSILRAVKPHRS